MLTQNKIDKLLKSGNWMIRFDNKGLSYNGFKWKGLGQWTIAPDWNDKAECGNGLHGQSPKGHGYCQKGSRLVLCETDTQICIDGNKVKTRRAKILAINENIPIEFFQVGGYLDLRGYTHPLPPSLQSVGGSLDLRGYTHPLPPSLNKRSR